MIVGVITTSYPRFAGDPAGNFVAGHVAALRALGHDVDVIAAGDRTDDGVTRIASRLFYTGGAPDALERGGHALDAASFTARLTMAVVRRARRWDHAIAHWLAPSALAALPTRVPLTVIAHGGDVHTLARARLLGPVLGLLRARRARLAFVTDELRRIAGAHDAMVQPMGVDTAHFAALDRAPETPPLVVVLARLVPIKGVDVALAAMTRVRTRARMIVAGAGPERARLAALAGPAELVGEVDAAGRDDLLRRASLVVVPSRVLANGRSEGMPLVALEALAAGVPVVASAVGGMRELGAPIALVPPDDPGALAHAIDTALARPATASELRAAVAHLDWPRVAARLLA